MRTLCLIQCNVILAQSFSIQMRTVLYRRAINVIFVKFSLLLYLLINTNLKRTFLLIYIRVCAIYNKWTVLRAHFYFRTKIMKNENKLRRDRFIAKSTFIKSFIDNGYVIEKIETFRFLSTKICRFFPYMLLCIVKIGFFFFLSLFLETWSLILCNVKSNLNF